MNQSRLRAAEFFYLTGSPTEEPPPGNADLKSDSARQTERTNQSLTLTSRRVDVTQKHKPGLGYRHRSRLNAGESFVSSNLATTLTTSGH